METFSLDKSTNKLIRYGSEQSTIVIEVDGIQYYIRHSVEHIKSLFSAIYNSSSLHGAYLDNDNGSKDGLVVFNDDEIFGTFGLVETEAFEICSSYSAMDVKRVYGPNESYKVIRLLWRRIECSPIESYFSKSSLYLNGNGIPTLFKKDTKYTLKGFNHSDTIIAELEDGGVIEFEYIRSKPNSLEISIIKNIANIDIEDINAKDFFDSDFVLRNGDKSSYFLCVCINKAPNDDIKNKLLSYI